MENNPIYIYIWKTESLCYIPDTNIVNQLSFSVLKKVILT